MDQSTPVPQPAEQVVITDIVAPPTTQTDVVAAPAQSVEELAEAQEAAAGQQQAPTPVPVALTKPKSPIASDAKLAIIATIVIVIALGVLATFAFLQQK